MFFMNGLFTITLKFALLNLLVDFQRIGYEPGMPKQTFYYGNRRDFIKSTSLLAGAAAISAPYLLRAAGANERINIACIGVGGKGASDSAVSNASKASSKRPRTLSACPRLRCAS